MNSVSESLSRQGVRGLVGLSAAAFFMQSLDSTIVNTAVPVMADSLGVDPLSMRSVLTMYVLALAICIPLNPWLCDRFGTRRVFAWAIGLFTFSSLLCSIAQNLPELVLARILQGMGGAALLPVGRAVMARSIDSQYLLRAISTVATFGLVGAMLGPLLGGILVQYTSWRMLFLINIPIGLAGLWFNRTSMPDYREEAVYRFDLFGFILFAGASILLLLISEHTKEWSPWNIGAVLVVALGFIGSYVWHSRKMAFPVADLGLLKLRNVWVALAGSLFARLGVSGMPIILSVFLQVGCGWSPLHAGLIMMPQALGAIAAKPLANALVERVGYRRLLLLNTTLVALLLASAR